MMKKAIYKHVVVLGLLTSIAFTGCDKSNKSMESKEDIVTPVQEATDKEESKKEESREEENSTITYRDLDRFVNIDEKKECEYFKSTFDADKIEEDYEFTGSFDFNMDGKADEVNVKCNRETIEATIKINDATLSESFPTATNVFVVDVDTNDSCKELVVFDNGLSDDPCYHFYRYDGTQIVKIGTIGTYFGHTIGIDGNNHAVALDSFYNELEPGMLIGYYTFSDKEVQYEKFDLTETLGKEYTVAYDNDYAFFKETNESVDQVECSWDPSETFELHAGDKVTINKVGDYERYEVKLSDGRVGILYFWIGD